MKVTRNDPVFPTYHQPTVDFSFEIAASGMPLIAYIATAALQGFLAAPGEIGEAARQSPDKAAEWAMDSANALIDRLNK